MAACFLDFRKGNGFPGFLYKNGDVNHRIIKRFLQRFNSDYSQIWGCSPSGSTYAGDGFIEYRRKKFNSSNSGTCSFATDKKVDVTSVSKLKVSISDFTARHTAGTSQSNETARIDIIIGLSATKPSPASTSSSTQSISATDQTKFVAWNYDANNTNNSLPDKSCLYWTDSAVKDTNASVDFADNYYKTLDLSNVTGSYYIYVFFREVKARVFKSPANDIPGLIINEIIFER